MNSSTDKSVTNTHENTFLENRTQKLIGIVGAPSSARVKLIEILRKDHGFCPVAFKSPVSCSVEEAKQEITAWCKYYINDRNLVVTNCSSVFQVEALLEVSIQGQTQPIIVLLHTNENDPHTITADFAPLSPRASAWYQMVSKLSADRIPSIEPRVFRLNISANAPNIKPIIAQYCAAQGF
jgi:hypothetical protein